jgi:hypothetical protein
LVFTEGDFESVVFPRIAREALENEVDPAEPERFEFLSVAADVIREVTPEDAPPEALDQYRLLLFHAFNFWRSGRPLFVLDPAAARFLVESTSSLQGWSFTMPADSIYLQLPANLFWSSISPEIAPEPIDGFFLTETVRPDHRRELVGHLEVLVVLGIRRSRAGFSVIPLRTELAPFADEVWATPERSGGDFRNVLPGGEISGLYSILTTGEVLKLLARVFAYADRHPQDLIAFPTGGGRHDGEPPPTHLAYTCITLGGGADGVSKA